jgi:anti-anti-sigma factor
MAETTQTNIAIREVYRVEEDIVASSATTLRTRMKDLMALGVAELVLDLSRVRMVDSAGIGLLISAHNSLKKTGGSLEITNASPEIVELFRSMRMHRHFKISDGK